MSPSAVVEREIERFQGQCRGLAQFVIPDQRGVADADAPLRQQPVGKTALFLRFTQRDAGDVEAPVAVTAQIQGRIVDVQQAQLELGAGDRPPGQDGIDPGKSQRRTPRLIVHLHVMQCQIGIDAMPAGFDTSDADGLPDFLAGQPFECRAIVLDVRQDAVAQRQHQDDEAEIDQPESPYHCPPQEAKTRRQAAQKAPGGGYYRPGHERPCQVSRSVTEVAEPNEFMKTLL